MVGLGKINDWAPKCGISDVVLYLGVEGQVVFLYQELNLKKTKVLYIKSNSSVTSYLIEHLHSLSYSNCETIHIVKHGGVLIHTLQMRSLRFPEVDGVKHGHTHVFQQRQCLDQFS